MDGFFLVSGLLVVFLAGLSYGCLLASVCDFVLVLSCVSLTARNGGTPG